MHTTHHKAEIIDRIRRITAELKAVERALNAEAECGTVLQLVAAVRGTVGALMTDVVDEDIRTHLVGDTGRSEAQRQKDAEDVIGIVRTYLK